MTPHAIIRAASHAATKGKVRCPNCGHLNDPGAEKCTRCGYPLKGGEKKASSPEKVDGPPSKKEPYLKTRLERGLMLSAAVPHLVGAGLNITDLISDMRGHGPRFSTPTLMAGPMAGAALSGTSLLLAHLRRKKERQQAEKKASIEYRGHTFPGYNQPIKSSRPEKKKMVLAKKGDEVRLIHFGQQGYKHNYSDAAKKNYLARSAGIRGKSGLTKDDKFSANYWARRELWPRNEPADGTAKNREKRASSEKEEGFAHKAELAGLGILATPYLAHLGAKIPGVRAVAEPVSHYLHANPTAEHLTELAGLGVLAAPSIKHLMAKKKESAKTASDDYLLGRVGRVVGNTFQKYPVPTLAAAYGVTKLPSIGKALRTGETEEEMPIGYAPALAASSVARGTDPETTKWLVRRAFRPV